MPLSRGRKSKKEKKAQGKSKKHTETFSMPGVELVREGKNVFVRTNRTDEQQAALVESLKASRPELLKALSESIERVIQIFSTYDKIKLLGMIACRMIIKNDDAQDDGAAELAMEYGQSFATSVESVSDDEPTPEIGNELGQLLYMIRQVYTQYVMTEFTESELSQEEHHMRFKTIIESLFMRGDGYPQHIYRTYNELFSGHDEFLKEKYGFTSEDILETFLQVEDSFATRVVFPGQQPPPFAFYGRWQEWRISKGLTDFQAGDLQPKVDFFADNPDIVTEDNHPACYLINDIATMEDLYRVRFRNPLHEKVIAAVSIKFGDNMDFLHPNYKGLPLNDSLSLLKPVIFHNNAYYVFAFNLLTRNIFTITEKLIMDADKKYYTKKYLGNDFSKSRDNYLEDAVTALFKAFIPNAQAHPNLKYKPGQLDENGKLIETEVDLLLESGKAIYLVEMKAGGLSSPARRGALKSLTGNLADIVGYGAYQSNRAYKYLTESDTPAFYDSKKNIIAIDRSKKIFRITITLEHVTGFLATLHDLQLLKIVDRDVQFAWTCSLFDLIIFSEILDSEDDFIKYLEQRVELYSNPSVQVGDEIDFLGYFLDNGTLVDKKMLDKVTNYKLNKTSSEIDDYYMGRGPKPKKKYWR